MSSSPTVCAVMLANGREEMVARAIASFRSQTYQEKRLLIWDTGELNRDFDDDGEGGGAVVHVPAEAYRDPAPTIGALRNEANWFWTAYPIIVHWDSDDWSHRNRIAEQVALLRSSGADCVGYREMLFWRDEFDPDSGVDGTQYQEAWFYSHPSPKYALGTSLCYWRRAWEANPFIDGNQEDFHFVQKVRTVGVSAIKRPIGYEWEYSQTAAPKFVRVGMVDTDEPRMVASIHGGNTCSRIEAACDEWTRVPVWDEYCRRIFEGQ